MDLQELQKLLEAVKIGQVLLSECGERTAFSIATGPMLVVMLTAGGLMPGVLFTATGLIPEAICTASTPICVANCIAVIPMVPTTNSRISKIKSLR